MGHGRRSAPDDITLPCGELLWHSPESEPCCVELSVHILSQEVRPVTSSPSGVAFPDSYKTTSMYLI